MNLLNVILEKEKQFINESLIPYILLTCHCSKVIYLLSDSTGIKYKNKYNFLSTTLHEDDYGVSTERHFLQHLMASDDLEGMFISTTGSVLSTRTD